MQEPGQLFLRTPVPGLCLSLHFLLLLSQLAIRVWCVLCEQDSSPSFPPHSPLPSPCPLAVYKVHKHMARLGLRDANTAKSLHHTALFVLCRCCGVCHFPSYFSPSLRFGHTVWPDLTRSDLNHCSVARGKGGGGCATRNRLSETKR